MLLGRGLDIYNDAGTPMGIVGDGLGRFPTLFAKNAKRMERGSVVEIEMLWVWPEEQMVS